MKTNTIFLLVSLLLLAISGTAKAGLIDYGLNNEMFFDTTLNQYFYDPHEFQGLTREEVGVWLGKHPTWRYAEADEVNHLLSNQLPIGDPAGTDWMIMGEPTSKDAYETAGGAKRYIFNWGGWMTKEPRNPEIHPHYSYVDWAEITMGFNIPTAGLDEKYVSFAPGYNYGEYAIGGAWLVTDIDPLSTPVPAPMLLLASGFFGLSLFRHRKK